MYRQTLSVDDFVRSPVVADPINILDSAGISDGAAAVLIGPLAGTRQARRSPVRIAASTCATDTIGLAERSDPLVWQSVADSARLAYRQAGVGPRDIDLFEVHDAFTIVSVLTLEACGFTDRGSALRFAGEGRISIEGDLPICTLGGLKGRGHPVGASGARLLLTLLHEMRRRGARRGIASLCVGGGQGAAFIVERDG